MVSACTVLQQAGSHTTVVVGSETMAVAASRICKKLRANDAKCYFHMSHRPAANQRPVAHLNFQGHESSFRDRVRLCQQPKPWIPSCFRGPWGLDQSRFPPACQYCTRSFVERISMRSEQMISVTKACVGNGERCFLPMFNMTGAV